MGYKTKEKENHQMKTTKNRAQVIFDSMKQRIDEQDQEIKGLRTEIQKLNEMIDTNGQGEG
jgi:hypothetical protein